ncbi:MAG: hypothetical protein QM802_19690 [Agriterribacter sp.]
MSKSLVKILPAFICAVIYIGTLVFHRHDIAGWFLMLFFLSLALSFRINPSLKGFSYTIMIFAAVSLAMYYPQYFIKVGDLKLSELIIPLLQVIMFGMGSELSLPELAIELKKPKGIIVGVICHYTIMPVVGFICAIFLIFHLKLLPVLF